MYFHHKEQNENNADGLSEDTGNIWVKPTK